MSDIEFNRASIDTNNSSQNDRGDEWEITFPIDVTPKECGFPMDLAREINFDWERKAGTFSGSSRTMLCGAEIEGNNVTFTVEKSETRGLEFSINQFERDMQSKIREYITKKKREAASGNDLSDILKRIRKNKD